MKLKKAFSGVAVMGLALSAGVFASAMASAEPSGCSHYTQASYTGSSSSQMIVADGHGNCDTSKNRTLRVEIKEDVPVLPDRLLSSDTDKDTKKTYHARTQSCDNGNVGTYYGRSFFTSSPSYQDTPKYTYHTCA